MTPVTVSVTQPSLTLAAQPPSTSPASPDSEIGGKGDESDSSCRSVRSDRCEIRALRRELASIKQRYNGLAEDYKLLAEDYKRHTLPPINQSVSPDSPDQQSNSLNDSDDFLDQTLLANDSDPYNESDFTIVQKKKKLLKAQSPPPLPKIKQKQRTDAYTNVAPHQRIPNDQDTAASGSAPKPLLNFNPSTGNPVKFRLLKTGNQPPTQSSKQGVQQPKQQTHQPTATAADLTSKQTSAKPVKLAASATSKAESPPPPIRVSDIEIKPTAQLLEQELGHRNFTFSPASRTDTYIRTTNMKDHHAVLAIIANSDVVGHSFTPKDEKKINIILRNACKSFGIEEIENGIIDMQIDVQIHKIDQFRTDRSKQQNRELGLWRIQLEPNSDVAALLSKTQLGPLLGVRFERQRSQGISQCRNCQDLGHAASNCMRPFRCVKCCRQHDRGQCPTDLENITPRPTPECVNCGGPHPANYRNCVVYKDTIKKVYERKRIVREAQERKQLSYNNFTKRNQSYAATVNPKKYQDSSNTNNPLPEVFNIYKECSDRLGMNFETTMQRLTEFAPTFHQAKDKSAALIQLIVSLHPSYQ